MIKHCYGIEPQLHNELKDTTMNHNRAYRYAVYVLCALSLSPVLARNASAAILPTGVIVESSERNANLERVQRALSSEQVRDTMLKMGVSSGSVDERLAGLSNAELASLADRLEQAPAGGDALAVIGIAFLVLLVLELTGVIDMFKSIGPVSTAN